MSLVTLIVFILAFFALVRAGAVLVHSLTGIARFFDVSEYLVAFVLMSFATSVPELAIGISAALQGVSELSLGNILGSNILDLTLVIGSVCLIANGIRLERKLTMRGFMSIFVVGLLPILLALDGVISRFDGSILLILLAIYVVGLVRDKTYYSPALVEFTHDKKYFVEALKQGWHFLLSIIFLGISAGFLVWAGGQVALAIGLGATAFGALVLAIGAALPELVFGVKAKTLAHADLAVGNILGGIVFKSLGVIGLVAVISPVVVAPTATFSVTAFFFIGAFFLFYRFIYTKDTINRTEGALLLLWYILFLIVSGIYLWI